MTQGVGEALVWLCRLAGVFSLIKQAPPEIASLQLLGTFGSLGWLAGWTHQSRETMFCAPSWIVPGGTRRATTLALESEENMVCQLYSKSHSTIQQGGHGRVQGSIRRPGGLRGARAGARALTSLARDEQTDIGSGLHAPVTNVYAGCRSEEERALLQLPLLLLCRYNADRHMHETGTFRRRRRR